jgi:hypothetical protein
MNRILTNATIAVFLMTAVQTQAQKGFLEIDQHTIVRTKTISVKLSFPCEVTTTGNDIRVSYTGEESKSYVVDGLIDEKRVVMAQTKKFGNSMTTFHYVGYFTSPTLIEGMGTVMRNGLVGDSSFTFTIRINKNTQPDGAANGSHPHASFGADHSLDELRQKLASPVYETRVAAVTELFQTGQKKPLSEEEIGLLLPPLKTDEWRIKVRILLVLPYAANPDWVFEPILGALRDRNENSTGGGNVPSGACRALVSLGESRGLQPCEDWLKYLESHPKAYGDLHATHVEQARKYIGELKEKR